ncbi:nitrilase [Pyrococcus abyssi]|uniref:Nitrilase n=1 Tax=Pyrococcus abyssi (strain GE5 / Orsay) TaxID=272844 RepID=NITR_PYRAB|nr:nitrilase [Pyrococcus abyssi]Q9UYV8.1 RecName: Full=Nitrilase; AltName: Full=PaNit [Pyrococcus abyssi GE5]CAB50304.1 Beta ureidopropionase (beta-alanine synthase) (EC 3.5.1.6) [Pyrococcus abyssi GE5]CCE70842.1 TPA: hydrolase related [Pyrococcus abyssi GE5]
MVKVAYVQMNPQILEPDKNYSKAEKLIKEASKQGAQLVVLPELFDTGYNFETREEVFEIAQKIPEGETTTFLMDVARDTGVYIVAGTAEKDGDVLYNSAVVVGPRGFIGKYRKIHLFYREKFFFEPGDLGFRVFDLGFMKVGVMICFDWFFPESARTLALKGADVIAHPANLVMPYAPRAMPIRALENKVYTVTADRVGEERGLKFIGKSLIASPKAEVLSMASETEEEVGVAEIDLYLVRNKRINDLNDIFKDRREEYYFR